MADQSTFRELIPPYLQRRREDLIQIGKLLEERDFHAIQRLGHKLCGNAATFGFAGLSQIGADLENAADRLDANRIEKLLSAFREYLNKLS